MKKIKKDELYENLGGFLSEKGVEFKDGAYSSRIRKGCSLLTDCINYTQSGIGKAKSKIDEKLDRMRQIIHDKTAPPPAKTPQEKSEPQPKPAKAPTKPAPPKPAATKPTAAKPATRKPAAAKPSKTKAAKPETPKEVKPKEASSEAAP